MKFAVVFQLNCLIALAFATSSAALGQQAINELNDDSFAAIRDLIVPDDDELAWQKIPWESTLWQAVRKANLEDKPLLIWAMNGHPLGCT